MRHWIGILMPCLGAGALLGCGSGVAAVDYFEARGGGSAADFGASMPSPGGSSTADGGSAPVAGNSAGSGASSAPFGSGAGAPPAIAGAETGGALDKGDGASGRGDGSSGKAGDAEMNDAPCSPVTEAIGKMSGPFGTTGAYCLRVTDDISGWGCSNFSGRTVKVNGVSVRCAEIPLPEKIHGAYYFDVSAGDFAYAAMYWYE